MAASHAHPDGPPARITAHIIAAHAPTASADTLPAGGPKRHAIHQEMHGGDLSKPAAPMSVSDLLRSARKR